MWHPADRLFARFAQASEPEAPEPGQTPPPCPYCGSTDLGQPEDTGRGSRITCNACGGVMVNSGDNQWHAAGPLSTGNHPSPEGDPSQGGAAGVANAMPDPDPYNDATTNKTGIARFSAWDEDDDEDWEDEEDGSRDEHGDCKLFPEHEHEHDYDPDLGHVCPYSTQHTDWDEVHPQLGDIHRGMGVHLPAETHRAVHDESLPEEHRARALLNHLGGRDSGVHWSPTQSQAEHYAYNGMEAPHSRVERGGATGVVLHAAKPAREDIETDPEELSGADVIGFGEHEDAEVPLRRGAPIHLKGVSWQGPHENQWHHYDLGSHRNVTAMVTVDDEGDEYHLTEDGHDLPDERVFSEGQAERRAAHERADALNAGVHRIVHADPSCRVCNAEAGITHTAAHEPPAYPNPLGGHHWFHGASYPDEDEDYDDPFDEDDEDDYAHYRHPEDLRPPDRLGSEYGENSREHWNTDLGVHFSALHPVASRFARMGPNKIGHGYGPPHAGSRIAHTELHMKNPAHYRDEEAMADHAIRYGREHHGNFLPDDEEAHQSFKHGDFDFADEDRDIDYSYLENGSPGYRDWEHISDIDKHGPTESHPLSAKESWLSHHPYREEITAGFQKHLKNHGHDGIVYGNSHEGPDRHPSAIAFHDTPFTVHHWQWLDPDHPDHDPTEKNPEQHYDPKMHQVVTRHEGKRAAIDGPDWCTWRRNERCTFPGTKSTGGSAVAVPVDRGPCPYATQVAQQACPMSSPAPLATQFRTGARDDGLVKEARFERTASWRDVRDKAKRIRREGGVFITVASADGVAGEVKGDHHVYETVITYVPTTQKTAYWACFLPDAPVMVDGIEIPISDVKPGDEVVTHTGDVRRVLRVGPRPYDGDIVRVKPRGDFRELIATADHQVLSANQDYYLEGRSKDLLYRRLGTANPDLHPRSGWSRISDLEPGDYLSRSIPGDERPVIITIPRRRLSPVRSKSGVRGVGFHHNRQTSMQYWTFKYKEGDVSRTQYFKTRNEAVRASENYHEQRAFMDVKLDPELSYWLGWYVAEGFIDPSGRRGYQVGFSLAAEEHWVVEQLDDIAWRKFGVRGNTREVGNKLDYRVSHLALHHLAAHLVGHGAKTKTLSTQLLSMPTEELQRFLEGWMLGDGCVERSGRHCITTANETLALQARELLTRQGFLVSIKRQGENPGGLSTTQNGGPIYQVRWMTQKDRIHQFHKKNQVWQQIESVHREHYIGDVWDVEVEGDHSFRAYGYNVHNCGCVYGGYAHGPRWKDRPCSHILSLRFEAQARGMFGKEVQSNTARPDWLTKTTPIYIQYERPSESHPKGRELTRRETPSGNMRTTWHSRSRTRHSSLDPSYSVDMDEPDEDYSYRMQHQAPESDYGAPAHDELPLEAGTSPIPEGHIRLYHYTPHDNVASIREHGLLESHARGDGGLGASNEPSAGTWASTHSPSGGLPTAEDHRAVVEFHAHPEQVSQRAEYPFPNEDPHEWAQRSPHHVIMRGDVAPHQIVAIHEPWHHPTRHLQGRGDLDQFSWLDDPEQNEGLENYTRAYRYLKHQQRTAVKHDSNGPTVAGLALKAADTGRVLMLQRGLDDESDPAAGTWEPPGGHIEPDDPTSLHAGIREWEEETGQPFPTGGVVTHAWTSPNGVYQGHVVVIPKEDQVDLSERQIENPDGDRHEQSAWWDVDDAKKNPALREEAKDTPWAKLTEAGDDAGLKVAGLLCIPAGEGRAHVRIQAQDAGGQNERMRPIPRAEELARPQTDAETLPYSYDDLTEFAEDHPEMTGRQAAVMDPLHSIDEAHPIEPPRHSDSENPGSSGWATSQDPPDWGSINHPDTLLPNADLGGFSANLHDEPEGALPSTDGESDDEDNDFHPTPYDSTSGMATPYEVRTGDSGEGNAAIPDVQSEGTPSSAHVSSVTDTVAHFQATAAAQALQEGGGEGGDMGFSTSEIAEAARERLGVSKTAMRDFSSSEQRELIEEGRGKRARNFDRLDIQGTHYSALQDALNAADLHDDDLLIL